MGAHSSLLFKLDPIDWVTDRRRIAILRSVLNLLMTVVVYHLCKWYVLLMAFFIFWRSSTISMYTALTTSSGFVGLVCFCTATRPQNLFWSIISPPLVYYLQAHIIIYIIKKEYKIHGGRSPHVSILVSLFLKEDYVYCLSCWRIGKMCVKCSYTDST